MYLPLNIAEIVGRLALKEESEHFIVHYEMRNPSPGKGLGPHGIRCRSLIDTYIRSLESLYAVMTSSPWNRQPPIVGKDGKTHVYVFNSGHPFTTYDQDKVPYIVLPSRNYEPTITGEMNRAAAEAVHEATHLFNYTKRPLHDKFNATRWDWFDEGMAVLMEMRVVKGNPDHYRFIPDWIDLPEMSLDHPDGLYQAGMFMRFVADRLGEEFINKVWLESDDEEEPLDAIERLTPSGQTFFDTDSSVPHIFAEYSREPYFLEEHDAEIFTRFGGRAVSESFWLPDANGVEIGEYLDHLSCRYYRFFLKDGASDFMVTVNVGEASSPLKAEITVVTDNKRRDMVQPVKSGNNGTIGFVLKNATDIDHFVLVISNFGTNRPRNGDSVNHDRCYFTIAVHAH